MKRVVLGRHARASAPPPCPSTKRLTSADLGRYSPARPLASCRSRGPSMSPAHVFIPLPIGGEGRVRGRLAAPLPHLRNHPERFLPARHPLHVVEGVPERFRPVLRRRPRRVLRESHVLQPEERVVDEGR